MARSCAFSCPLTFGDSEWLRARVASSKGTVSLVAAWFRADFGTNLLKQGDIVTVLPCGPIAQWSEYSHGQCRVLDSVWPRAFSCPVTLYWFFCYRFLVIMLFLFEVVSSSSVCLEMAELFQCGTV